MPASFIPKPQPNEYNPYFDRYISLIPEGDVLTLLQTQLQETVQMLSRVPEAHAGFRYAADKWSIKEAVGHMCDTERIMSYRALRVGRGDTTALPGFEQDDYIKHANFDRRMLSDLVQEFQIIRQATLWLFRDFDEAVLQRMGTSSNAPISVRALVYIVAGHERHHLNIFRAKYNLV